MNIQNYIDNMVEILVENISKKPNHHFYEDDNSQEIIVELISKIFYAGE